MKEPNEIERIDKEERTIFIILSIILLIAIAIIVTWYFTNNKYDNKKPENIIKEDKDKNKNEDKDKQKNKIEENYNDLVIVPIINKEDEEKITSSISAPASLSAIVFKNNNIYEIPRATAKDSKGNSLIVTTRVQYLNRNNEILYLTLDEHNQIIVPGDAIELIFSYVAIDIKGNEIIEVIKVPVKTIYSVIFNNAGLIQEIEINKNEIVEKPDYLTEFITKEETLTFGGWYTSLSYLTEFDFNTKITSPITLYAKWGYLVEYQEEIDSVWTTIDTKVIEPGKYLETINTERINKVFGGWFIEDPFDVGGLVPYDNPNVTIDIILKGQWVDIKNPELGKSSISVLDKTNLEKEVLAVINMPDIINDGDKNILEIVLDTKSLWDPSLVTSSAIKLSDTNEDGINDNAKLLFNVKAPSIATKYRTNASGTLLSVLDVAGDKYIEDSIDMANVDEIDPTKFKNISKTGTETRKYYWYDDMGCLISISEIEISMTEAP